LNNTTSFYSCVRLASIYITHTTRAIYLVQLGAKSTLVVSQPMAMYLVIVRINLAGGG